jgi:CelD/BcsL family acetyltransferase involved in cellulose biosynthesis
VLRCTRAEIMPLVEQWAALHTETCSDNPFIHPGWCTAWLDCYQPEHPRVLTDQDAAGRIRILAAFTAPGPTRRHWSTLGAPLVDFGSPLAPRGPDGIDALVELLAAHRSDWHSVMLTGTDDRMARALTTVQPRSGVAFRIVATDISPRVAVPSFEAWAAALPRGRWKRLAAARRSVETQPGFSRALI